MSASMTLAMPSTGVSEIPYDWPHRNSSRLTASQGSIWHVQRAGQGDTILLLHGTAASTHTWRDVIPALSGSFDVLAVDLPGHGFSERVVGGGMSLDDISDGIAGLLHDLKISPSCIVGHSAGAAVALNLVLKNQVDAGHIIGINAALLPFGGTLKNLFSPLARFFASTQLMPRMLARRAADKRAVERVLNGTGSTIDSDGMEYYQRLFQRESHLSSVLQMMASWELGPLLRELPGLQPQLMLIVGEQDQAVSPKEADSVARLLSKTEVMRLPGLGHLAHEEAPERIAELVEGFISAGDSNV
ncbi:MAG: alpha/beta fold hydrolase [Woeseiaceae bacterium]|nr:alpha/beta fold hydrolase [Woeseiaceae bacterium]